MICLVSSLPLALVRADSLVPEADEDRDVKLSEAMDSAAKGDGRDLGGKNSSDDDDDWDDESDDSERVSSGAAVASVSYRKTDYAWQIPLEVRYATSFSGDISALTHITMTPFSIEGEKELIGVFVGGAIVDLESGSLPDRATDDQWMFEVGLVYRRYLNGSHTALSPYLAAGFGCQFLFWDYRNPIYADGDRIEHDMLSGFEGYAGVGISTKRDSWVSFFAEVDIGATGFMGTTREGFENDVFDAFGFFSVKAGLTLKF